MQERQTFTRAVTSPAPPATQAPAPADSGHGSHGGRPTPGMGGGASSFKLSTFSSLRHRDYRYLWLGVLFSGCGQWIQQVTLSWMVYDMTGSAVQLGAINGMRSIPFLISGPLAGVAADRWDRKTIMAASQALLLVTSLAMALLIMTGLIEVWHLYAFTLITGVSWSFNMPVRQALVPALVPKEDLLNAVALNSAAFNMTRIVGPSLGGLMIAWFGVANNFLAQAVVYGGVVAMIMMMNVPALARGGIKKSMGGDLKEGLSYVWNEKPVLTLMLLALIPMVFSMPYVSLMPMFARDVLNSGPEGLGLLMAAPGIGALVATFTLASLQNFRRKGLLLISAVTMLGFFLILFSQSSWMPLSLALLTLVGACQISFMATNNTLLQLLVPDELRGRVMSIYMLDQGLMPLGSLFAGVMAAGMGAPFAVTVMGAIVVVLALGAFVRVPAIRRME